jgi:Ni,Fe-hydrogenase III small subunit/Pyruvate/2-oxoacid:ferredoxin oxidoreductase delta subunit
MANWVWKGLATGVVTTRYPFGREELPGAFGAAPVVTEGICSSACSKCLEICFPKAVGKTSGSPGAPVIDYAKCLFCLRCADVCPEKIIRPGNIFELACLRNESRGKATGEAGKTRKAAAAGRLFRRSLHIRHVDAGSCEACLSEVHALSNPYYDLHRLGLFFVNSPRHADALLVSGPVTKNMEEALLKTYQAMPAPKLVIAAGSCAAGGGPTGTNYACVHRLDDLLPVDLVIPGCPPGPLTLLHGLLLALGRAGEREEKREGKSE